MKKLLKRLELICLVLMLSLSMTACGNEEERETSKISKEEKSDKKDKNKDEDEEDDDEEEKKSSKEEEKEEPTPEPTAEPQDETRKYDEEALAVLKESWLLLEDFFESEEPETLVEAREVLKDINRRKCAPEIRQLIEEDEVILKDIEWLFEYQNSFESYMAELNQIDTSFKDLQDLSTLDEIRNEYYKLEESVAQIELLNHPQIFQHVMENMVEIIERYRTLLSELYDAQQKQDLMTVMSAYCFYEDLKTEMEILKSDINKMSAEFEEYMNPYLVRFEKEIDEFKTNYQALEENDYEGIEFPVLDEIQKTKVMANISCIDTIYPAMYNRLQAVSIVNLSYANGEKDVLVTVEVDGFSQKYEKTITVNQSMQRFYIKPPVISSGLNLDSQKKTQIKVTITDMDTGSIIASETENVKIMSINDFILSSNEYGYTNYADVLAWVTPESNYIQELLRIAADNMEEYTGYNGIAGYQRVADESDIMLTAYQVYAIQKAISDVGVRYVMSSYSIGEATNATQRVNRPDETLLSKSGICIETSVLMASALQAAGFNSMIVLTTGHCQVAVETWKDSGEYLLIETTVLPVEEPWDSCNGSDYLNVVMKDYDIEEWAEYLEPRNGMIYSCDLATYMGIIPLVYE